MPTANPTANPVAERAAAVRTVAIDAAPVIAACVADLPTNRGTRVTFAFHEDTVIAVISDRVTTDERDTVITTVTRHFETAGWGYAFYRHGIQLTHPAHLALTGRPPRVPTPPAALSPLTGCLPEHAGNPAVRDVLGMLAASRVPLVDLASERAHRPQATVFPQGAVATPSPGDAVSVEWYANGAAGELGMPSRSRKRAREHRNWALDECAALLRGAGYTVHTAESSRTSTRRVDSLTVSGKPSDLARDVVAVLGRAHFAPVGVLREHTNADRYSVLGGHRAVDDQALLSFSYATTAARTRAAIAALRGAGFNAHETSTRQARLGYAVDVAPGGRPTEGEDGTRPDTALARAARDVLWDTGFSPENTVRGTIGHRVQPRPRHDRVCVAAPANAYADGEGRQRAQELSAAHESAFTDAGWAVNREDAITITVQQHAS